MKKLHSDKSDASPEQLTANDDPNVPKKTKQKTKKLYYRW